MNNNLKISLWGRLTAESEGACNINISIGKGVTSRNVSLNLGKYDFENKEPIKLISFSDDAWAFKDKVFRVEGTAGVPDEEIKLRIKHLVLKQEKELKKIEREIQALENLEALPSARRGRIPDSVRLFVWQRDEGKCANCGGKKKLEFDHIIPIIEGGSNTERNIQLLCEVCNRSKGKNIL